MPLRIEAPALKNTWYKQGVKRPTFKNHHPYKYKYMKFDCKEVSINDEEHGCTLTLSENEDNGASEMPVTVDEILSSIGQYIMLQRTYPEDEFEKDYYYFETNDPDKSGELKNFRINLYRTQFIMSFGKELFEIKIKVDDQVFEKLKLITKKITNKKGQLNFHD